jgi:hypothetical protein
MEENQILQAIKELQEQMNERFDKLETRMMAVETSQQEMKDSIDLPVKENWNPKKDVARIEKPLGMN